MYRYRNSRVNERYGFAGLERSWRIPTKLRSVTGKSNSLGSIQSRGSNNRPQSARFPIHRRADAPCQVQTIDRVRPFGNKPCLWWIVGNRNQSGFNRPCDNGFRTVGPTDCETSRARRNRKSNPVLDRRTVYPSMLPAYVRFEHDNRAESSTITLWTNELQIKHLLLKAA